MVGRFQCPPVWQSHTLRWSLPRCLITIVLCSSTWLGVRGTPGIEKVEEEKSTQPEQILVFDAGSSGTRIHVFNFSPIQPGAHVPMIDLSVREQQTRKIKPGLSSFSESQDLDGAQQSIDELLAFADGFVPAARRAGTPALLMATAGLRAVDQAKSGPVLSRVQDVLRRSSYRFDENSWARIITGAEEGGLGWVAANYLQGTFGDSHGAFLKQSPPSIGVIELGGGSAQVTFEVDPQFPTSSSDTYLFTTANGRHFPLYAHSYLGYGQDYAQNSLREKLSGEAGNDSDPCYPRGYQRDGPVVGAGNAADCESKVLEHVFGSSDAPGKYASEPQLRGSFVAIENFFYTRNELSLPLEGSLDAMSDVAENACGATFEPETDSQADPSTPKHCFAFSYQVSLLKALKASAAGVTVDIVRQINGGDIDWSVGAVVVHAIQMHRSETSGGDVVDSADLLTGDSSSTPTLLLAFSLLFLCLALAVRFWFRGSSAHKGT